MSSTINNWQEVDHSRPAPALGVVPNSSAASIGFGRTISSNVVASLARVAVVSLVSILLPAYLTHRLPVEIYAAWVLILQLAAYVSYLDLGIQTAVSKYVAEFNSRNDHVEAGRHASAGLALMVLAGMLGLILTLILALQVPKLFREMPENLYHEVRLSLILVGSSVSIGLVCSAYSAVFLGLQRYKTPMAITIANRLSYAVVVVTVVALRGKLVAMSLALALVNVVTGFVQVVAWREQASHISMSLRAVETRVLRTVGRFCSTQSVWTMGMLCVTGLDVAIVGYYDYLQTAYYSIATLPTNFMLMMMSAMLSPIMPAASAMSTQLSGSQMGDFLGRITRYTTLILLLIGLPLIVYGLPILRIWVGSEYARHTITYLRILIIANVIRNLCAPYATMISGTGKQGAAIVTAAAEALVNLSSSVYLASRYGAIGVALGTLLGAFVSLILHFAITMRLTRSQITISRIALLANGVFRPALIILPSLALIPLSALFRQEWSGRMIASIWMIATTGLAWFYALQTGERHRLIQWLSESRLKPNPR